MVIGSAWSPYHLDVMSDGRNVFACRAVAGLAIVDAVGLQIPQAARPEHG
jgi:hypothetical protein